MKARKRRVAVRFIRVPWNAKKSTCERCGASEPRNERLLFRLSCCTACLGIGAEG